MLGSHTWQQTTDTKCRLCNKLTYSLFVWNYQVQTNEEVRFLYYQQSTTLPLKWKLKYPHPVAVINGEIHRMIPLDEFVQRLETKYKSEKLSFRACNNEVELKHAELLKEKMKEDIKKSK